MSSPFSSLPNGRDREATERNSTESLIARARNFAQSTRAKSAEGAAVY